MGYRGGVRSRFVELVEVYTGPGKASSPIEALGRGGKMGEKIYRLSDLIEIEPGSVDVRLTLAESLSMARALQDLKRMQEGFKQSMGGVMRFQQSMRDIGDMVGGVSKAVNDQMMYAGQALALVAGGLPRDYKRGPEIIITPSRARHLALLDELNQFPSNERMGYLNEVTTEMERLPQEQRRAYLWEFFQMLPPKHRTDSLWEALRTLTLEPVRIFVPDNYHREQITPAISDQTRQENKPLPIPEGSTQTDRRKGGRRRLQSHQKALQRLLDGQTREANFYQWKKEYEAETGTDPEHLLSGAWDNHRKSVWEKFAGNN